MSHEKANAGDGSGATVERNGSHVEGVRVIGRYDVVCLGPDGKEKWRDSAPNLVTTVGKNHLLDTYFRGSGYTQTVRMGLKGAGSAAAGDTMASHGGWTERGGSNAPLYTGNRKDVTLGAASSGSSVSPVQAFAIVTTGGTVAGCFMVNGGSATKDDTTGTLYSAGDFTGGDKVVSPGDTLNVTYTATV